MKYRTYFRFAILAILCVLLGVAVVTTVQASFSTGPSMEEIYARKAQSNPQSLRAALDLALWHLEDGDYAKAEPEYRAILAKHPDALSARYHLGEIYLKQGKTEEARQSCREIVRLTEGRKDKYAASWRDAAKAALQRLP